MAEIQLNLNQTLERWAWYTLQSIRDNFRIQRISPFYPYSPAGKKGKSNPFRESTGNLYNSIFYKILNAAGNDHAKVDFFFNYYALYVDLGVGRGQSYSQVDNAQKRKRHKRYKKWKGPGDRQSRPAVVPEIRYQSNRLARLLATRFAIQAVRPIYMLASDNPDYIDGEIINNLKPEFL